MSSVRAVSTGPDILPALAEVDVAPSVRGKFIFVGDDKLYVRGVTYGTFRPDADGHEYPALAIVERDFARMAACGVNAVRVYTVPPPWLLDSAWRHGLRVMVGLPVERYVGLLADKKDGVDHLEAVVLPACAPAGAIPRSSAMRSATRSRRRSCAGTAADAWSASSSDSTGPQRPRMPRRSPPT